MAGRMGGGRHAGIWIHHSCQCQTYVLGDSSDWLEFVLPAHLERIEPVDQLTAYKAHAGFTSATFPLSSTSIISDLQRNTVTSSTMDTLALKVFLISLLVIVVAKAASIPKPSSISGRNYFIAHACERTILTMSCEPAMKIHLVHATYGRQNMRHCNNGRHADAMMWSNRCMAPVRRTTSVVAEMCNGRQTCVVPVINMLFSDPCPTTFKYLEIYYICVAQG